MVVVCGGGGGPRRRFLFHYRQNTPTMVKTPEQIAHDMEEDERAVNGELLVFEECSTCRRNLPLSDKFFYRDNRRGTGFKKQCRECCDQVQEDATITELSQRIHAVDMKMLRHLENLASQADAEDAGVPHLARFVEVGLRCYGGLAGFWEQVYANRLAAKPGSKIRQSIDESLFRGIVELSRSGAVKIPVDLMTDEDLDKEINKKLRLVAPPPPPEPEEPDEPDGEDQSQQVA